VRVLTGPDGTFTIAGLPPGTYRIEVQSAGFKRTTQQNIVLTAGAPITFNIILTPGSMNETVEIKGRAPVIQTEGNEMSLGLNTRTVREMPIIDRNHQQLMDLQPGVTPPLILFPLAQDPQRQREWNTNGQPYFTNHQYLDGINNLERMQAIAVRVVPVEAIQQFNIATANYPESRGFATGSITNVVTRPGTNGWHGSAFEFWSGNALSARGPFELNGNTPRLNYNQFGITVGGPIKKDRYFVFGSWEGNYNRGAISTITTVPTAAMAAGDFSAVPTTIFNPSTGTPLGTGRTAFLNNKIPAGSINPVASALLPLIPTPNLPGFENNFGANVPYANDWQKADGRVDAHFTDNTLAFLRYGFANAHSTQNSIFGSALGLGDAGRVIGQNVVLDGTHIFGPTLIGTGRVGYNRYVLSRSPMGSQAPIGASMGITGAPDQFLPTFQIAGGPTIGSNAPFRGVDNNWQGSTAWSWHTARHNIRFGIDIQHYQVNGFDNLFLGQFGFGPIGSQIFSPGATLLNPLNPALGTASLFPNSFAAFLLGAPTQTGTTHFTTTPTARDTWFAGWVGDNLTFGRFSIDLGARYEVYSPVTPRNAGGAQVFNPVTNTIIPVVGDNFSHWDLNNIAPRVGIAFHLWPKTVIRTGYAINFFQVPFVLNGFMPAQFGTYAGTSGTFTPVAPFTTATFPALLPVPSPTTSNAATNGPLNAAFRPNAVTPYVQEFNFQIQQEFMDGIVLAAAYQGALGRKLPFSFEGNQGLPGTGVLGLPLIGNGRIASTPFFQTGLNSNYNALQVNLTKRMGHGFQFQGAYTFSKALGFNSSTSPDQVATLGYAVPSQPLTDPFNRRANYGPLNFDRQHMLTIAHVWDLPFGTGTNHMNRGMIGQILGNWALNGQFVWATGIPYTVTADPIFYGGPNGFVQANVVGPVNSSTNLNPNSFSVPINAFPVTARNILRGPTLETYNFSLFKTFAFHDRYKFELRGEAYNLLNSPSFVNPQTNLSAAGFGTSTNVVNGFGAAGRQVNVALRVLF
jgi:hypothetical protein